MRSLLIDLRACLSQNSITNGEKKFDTFSKKDVRKKSRNSVPVIEAKARSDLYFLFLSRMYPRHSIGPSLDWATTSVLSPGWDTPRIPGAPAGSDTTTPVGVTWIRVTRGCIAPAAIAWGIRWWRRAEVYAARRSSSTCGGTFRPAPAHATTWAMGITWTIRWVKYIYNWQIYLIDKLDEGFSKKGTGIVIEDIWGGQSLVSMRKAGKNNSISSYFSEILVCNVSFIIIIYFL